MQIGYFYDKSRKERLNKRGKNFWFEYIKEIFCQLGISGKEVSPTLLEVGEDISEVKVLFIEDSNVQDYGVNVVRNIKNWVNKGGMLIGFGTEGLDDLFGNTYKSYIKQTGNDFTIAGYFSFEKHRLTSEIHSPICPSQKLLIFSVIRAVASNGSKQIAGLYMKKDGGVYASAITINSYGKGYAVYFCFDVTKTFWVLHQGRPIYEDIYHEGWLRTPQKTVVGISMGRDGRSIKKNSDKVGYVDEILFLLQNIIALTKYPFIYQIPPRDDKIPVALFHWAGDDEGNSTGIQIKASNWMKEKRLPYHINVMEVAGKKIPLTKEDALKIIENGHEISCHYNFTIYDGKQKKQDKDNPLKATKFEVKRQSKLFRDKFGLKPLSGANHCCIWYGGCEPTKWMEKVGGLATNCFLTPGITFNANSLNFGFGTSYPYFFYDNYKNENKRINFMSIPVTGYELGHKASGGGDKMETDFSEVHMAVNVASYYHLIFNMFFHPVYIHEKSGARLAIEEFLNYVRKNKLIIANMGTNAVAQWWAERAKSKISNVIYHKNTLFFDAFCFYKGGMIIKVSIDDTEVNLMIDGRNCEFEAKKEFGSRWLYFICPYGSHKIQLNFNTDSVD